MYKAYLGSTCILDANLGMVLDSPVLTLEDNAAGSFNFTIYPDNPGYEIIDQYMMASSALAVYWEDELLYKGRILGTKLTWDKSIMVESEGDFAMLDDTIQRPAEYHEMTVRGYLEQLIALHNAKAGSDKQFRVGAVTVTDSNDSLYRYTNWESTLTALREDLIDSLGGHFRVRYDSSGNRLLDYLADYPRVSEQKIEFGSNLLDYSSVTDGTSIATVCIPLGARQEESDIEALEKRLTIESVNSGSDELSIQQAVNAYGRITRTVTWDDVNTAENLKAKGQQWLQDNQYSEVTLELSAVDLADFGISADHLRILDEIQCTSAPHGMDRRFPLTKVQINLLDAEQNTYTLGSKQKSFAASSTRSTYQALTELATAPSTSYVLKRALENAAALINMYGDDGHVVITNNEIYIMDTDNKDTAQKVWRWNLGGLAYSKEGYAGPYELAITMDGTIAGKFIAAQTVAADQISASYTTSQDKKWQDELGNNYWKATTTETKISNSATSVTTSVQSWAGTNFYTKSQIDTTVDGINSSVTTKLGNYYSKSEVDQKDSAIITTVSTKVGSSEFGTMIEQNSSHVKIAWNNITSVIKLEDAAMNIYNGSNKIISFNSNGMDHYYSTHHVGRIGTNSWSGNSSMRGLTFDLDYESAYMAWACQNTSGGTYYTVLCYTNKTYSSYKSGYLNLGANLDCHGYAISGGSYKGRHWSYDNHQGCNVAYDSGSLRAVYLPTGIRDDGTVSSYSGPVYVNDGLVVTI